MNEDQNIAGGEEVDPFREHDIMKLFDELTFRQKWARVSAGLKQPKESGEYKWAKFQLLRLLSPAMAVLMPIVAIALISVLAQFNPETTSSVNVKVMEPEPMEEIEEIEIPEVEPPEPTEVVEVQMDVVSDMPSLPTETVTPPADKASVQPSPFDAVAMVKSPVIMKSIMGSRNPGTQGAALAQFGGGHTTVAVIRALRWLAKTQESEGSWGRNKLAMTSLAVLAYLAHGDTPASPEFGPTVERALRFLVEKQTADGRFTGRDGHDYTQPIVAYALAEAAGMTRNPTIRDAAVKAIKVVIKGQNKNGSFDYSLKPGGSERSDLSYAGWCIQALKAAKIAGFEKDVDGLSNAVHHAVAGVKWHYAEKGGYGGFHYASPGVGGLTGVGILCLQFLGESKSKEVRTSLPTLANYGFSWAEEKDENEKKAETASKGNLYFWYYNTQAYFQEGGATWDAWNKEFSGPLVNLQKVITKDTSGYVDHKGDPHDIGFWEGGPHFHNGGEGAVFTTLLSTLMLEVYYRYLPTFQVIPDEEIKQELQSNDDIVIDVS